MPACDAALLGDAGVTASAVAAAASGRATVRGKIVPTPADGERGDGKPTFEMRELMLGAAF